MKKFNITHAALSAFAITALFPAGALANATAVDNAAMGTHPWYGNSYAAYWHSGSDYSLLSNSTHTYINSPLNSGAIMFRGNNTATNGVIGPDGGWSRAFIDSLSRLYVGGGIYSSQTVSGIQVGGVPGIQGSTSGGGVAIFGTANYGGHAVHGQANAGGVAVYADGDFYTTANAYKPGGGQFLAFSDARVKKDVADFSGGLKELENVHVVKFKYNGLGETKADGKEYVGVIAQELEKAIPFMVSSQKKMMHENDKEKTEIKQVDPSAFTYMLINAVKDLARQNREIVAQNKKQNEELLAQNKELKRALCEAQPTATICVKEVASTK